MTPTKGALEAAKQKYISLCLLDIRHSDAYSFRVSTQWLFKSRRGLAVTAGIFVFLLASILPIVTGLWSIAGSGNPITPITHALLTSTDFRNAAGKEFVRKTLKDASGDEKRLLTQKGKDISQALSDLLGQPAFESEINKVTSTAYDYFSTGAKTPTSIDAKPIANMALLALAKVDKDFSKLKKEVRKLKPIELKPQTSGPDIVQIRKILNLVFFGSMLLFVLLNLIYLRYSRSITSALRTIGSEFIYFGVLDLVINLVANPVVKSLAEKNSEPLAQIAIPIVARQELAIFMTFGIVGLVVGAALQVLALTKFKKAAA